MAKENTGARRARLYYRRVLFTLLAVLLVAARVGFKGGRVSSVRGGLCVLRGHVIVSPAGVRKAAHSRVPSDQLQHAIVIDTPLRKVTLRASRYCVACVVACFGVCHVTWCFPALPVPRSKPSGCAHFKV